MLFRSKSAGWQQHASAMNKAFAVVEKTQLAAIRAGFGVGVCQYGIARRNPDLVAILPQALGFELETWIAMHEDLRNSRRMRLMFDHLAQALTAYAATSHYQPSSLLARNLVRAGAIGTLYEVEFISHYRWPQRLPYGWPHQLKLGGGRLNRRAPVKVREHGGRPPGCGHRRQRDRFGQRPDVGLRRRHILRLRPGYGTCGQRARRSRHIRKGPWETSRRG